MQEAAHELACTFEFITGLRPRVAINATREADGTRLIAVGYPGDEMLRAMQIEAFVVEKGDRIQHRSQQRNGLTVLSYHMVPKAAPAMGGFHLSTVKPPRIVPAGERHKWSGPAVRGGKAVTCQRCGCVKRYCRDYSTTYRMPDGPEVTERPNCTG
jgi:hypothetical protein